MSDATSDLNATITNAVQARISAEVMRALSGDEVIGQFVAAALNEPQKKDAYDTRRRGPTYLDSVIRKTFQEIAASAVRDVLEEEREAIRDEVRRALKRRADGLADSIVTTLDETVKKSYGVSVQLKMPNADD